MNHRRPCSFESFKQQNIRSSRWSSQGVEYVSEDDLKYVMPTCWLNNAFSIFCSIRTAAPARVPEVLAVVSNDSAFTFSSKCQSLIAATTAFAVASPVPLGSLGTFKRRST